MKKSIGKKTLIYTHPVFIVGSYDAKEIPNMMAASWGGICCSQPPCIAVSLRKATYSYHNILHSGAFSINIPSVDFVCEADYVGIESGREVNKFEATGLTAVRANLVNAPIIDEFPINLECKLIKTVELGLHTQFIGEILDVLADEDVLGPQDLPLLDKVKPFIYDSACRCYYGIGGKLIDAYTCQSIKKEK